MRENQIVQHGAHNEITSFYLVLLGLSFIACTVYGFLILSNKKMRETDSGLAVMYLAFIEASYAAFMIQSYYACDLGYPSIFASTVYWNTDQSWEEQKLQAAHVLA